MGVSRALWEPMTDRRTLWRFPGPLALGRVLDGAPPTLHHPDAQTVYLGDRGLWSWPGVTEFGALSIFDAERLDPRPGPVSGWFVVDPAPLDAARVLYVPDRRCADAVAGCPDVATARARLPAHYPAAVGEARQAIERYDAITRRMVDGLRALTGDGVDPVDRLPRRWRTAARTPLHMLPPARRRALVEAVGRAAAAADPA